MATKQISQKGIGVNTALMAIFVLTFIAFLPTFSNGYVFWDDPEYILHNPLMMESISKVFSSYYLANYHPLTILFYTVEHTFFGVDMMGYHAVSLLLHIANSLLVFFFIYYLLSKKNVIIPLAVALLFAIHPMHVESVAWASELKDVLYTFFFLASLICYVLYLQKGRSFKYIAYALALYVLSLISKGQAVTLPLCFLLVDFLFKRKWSTSMVIDKVPFFVLSAVFGIVAIKAQGSAILVDHAKIYQPFFWGFYGLSRYLLKFILPINLSGLYPYPYTPEGSLPLIVYASPLIIALLAFVVYKFFKRDRFVLFGLLFFCANMVTVLKFIPVADAVIADRYTYIPYIGLFFVVAYWFNKLLTNPAYSSNKKVFQYGGVFVLLVLSSMTWARTTVWKNSLTFWGDALEKNDTYWRPYYCIGQDYYDKGDYASAVKYFTGGIEHDKYCPPTVYMWRGITYLEKLHKADSAIADFKSVLNFGNKSDPSQLEGRLDLGLAYYRQGMYKNALDIYNELIAMDPGETVAYFQRGLVYQYGNPPQSQLALADYNKAIEMNPEYVDAYLDRGSLYVDELGKYDLGIADFNKVLELQPDNPDAPVNKGIAYYKAGNYTEALNTYNQAMGKGNNNGKLFYLEALVYAAQNDYAKALQSASQAQQAGVTMSPAMLQEWQSKMASR